MASAAAARRYARALFALARDEDRVSPVRDELAALAGLIEAHPELRQALFRPVHPAAQRKAALAALAERLGSSVLLGHFLQYLIDQRRLIDFGEIRAEYERLADAAAGRVHAELSSATPLADVQVERLRRALVARSGRDVAIRVAVDPTLLGGVVAKLGDLVFDGSLRTQLAQLRASLMKEE
jgi:F-type H+-transporting ATPase subunit delta